jgi:hypothetical protein
MISSQEPLRSFTSYCYLDLIATVRFFVFLSAISKMSSLGTLLGIPKAPKKKPKVFAWGMFGFLEFGHGPPCVRHGPDVQVLSGWNKLGQLGVSSGRSVVEPEEVIRFGELFLGLDHAQVACGFAHTLFLTCTFTLLYAH